MCEAVSDNFFMLWAPFEVKRLRLGKGWAFTILFTIAAATAVGLLFIPASLDLAMGRSFDIGFVLWAASLIMASVWLSRAVWKRSLATLPQIPLGATLFCGLFVWSPFLDGKAERAKLEHQQALQQAQRQEQRHAEETAALNAIAQHGLVAFSEPLHDTEEMELEFRINSTQPIAPGQLIAASEHYQNPQNYDGLGDQPK